MLVRRRPGRLATDTRTDPLRAALAEAAVGLAITDTEGTITHVNDRLVRLAGRASPEQVVGGREADLAHPDDRPRAEAMLAGLLEGERDHFVLEKRYVRPNGSVAHVRASVAALPGEEGRLEGVAYLVEDVTEAVVGRNEAERLAGEALNAREALDARIRQQAQVAELGADALRGVDLDTLFERAVRDLADVLDLPLAKILEMLPAEEDLRLRKGVGWKPGLVGTARVSGGPGSQAGYTLLTGGPVVVRDLYTETRFRGPALLLDHGVISGVSVLIPGEEGPYGVLGVHDTRERAFTEDDIRYLINVANVLGFAIARKRSEDRMAALTEGLERVVAERTRALLEANRRLEAFSFMVAHDLRAPVRGMSTVADFALRDHAEEVGEELRKDLETIRASSHRLSALIEDLLRFAQAGEGELRRQEVDVTAMAREVAEEMPRRFPQADPTFVVEPGLRAAADPALLHIVLDNVLSNAWKFSAKRGVEARVELGRVATSERGEVVLFVRDNGVGFDAKKARSLFEPFQRFHAWSEYAGTGVGLATVKRIVERHGGRVWAESKPGAGATFYLALPEA